MYKVSAGKLEGKRPNGRPICRGEYNIKTNHKEIEIVDMDLIRLGLKREQ
jgi:hypothetical protein